MADTPTLPVDWEIVKLGDVVDIAYGKNLPVKRLIDEGFPVFGANGQIGWYSQYTHENEEVLITCRGATCGTINWSLPKSFVTNNSMILSPYAEQGVEKHFLHHLLTGADKSSVISGSAQPQITIKDLELLRVPLPPFNEQRRIADKIDTLQAKSRRAREALETLGPLLEKFRQSVLAAAFRGDLTAEWRKQHPDVEPAEKLLERIRAERRARWEEAELAKMRAKGSKPKNDKWKVKYKEPEPVDATGLPELPKGWCWASVDEIIVGEIGNGISVRGSDFPPGVPALKLNALTSHGVDYSQKRYIPISEEKAKQKAIHKGDFLVSRGNGTLALVGKGSLVSSTPEVQTVFPDTVIRVQFSKSLIGTHWVTTIWACPFVRKQIEARAKTTAGIWKVSQADLKSLVIPLPPHDEQLEACGLATDGLVKSEAIAQQTELMGKGIGKLDQSILAKAFRGELIPQDPNDEPASVLLERIKAEREDAKGKKTTRRKRK